MSASHVIIGDRIRRRAGEVGPGYVAISGDRIVATGWRAADAAPWIGRDTVVHESGGGLVTAGFHDEHTFFTSQLLTVAGVDVGSLPDEEVRALLSRSPDAVFLRNADVAQATRLRDAFEDADRVDAVMLTTGRERLVATRAARARLGDPDPASNEQLAPLYERLAADPAVVEAAFLAARDRMHRGGVTSVKDIAFDTHLGMLPVIDTLIRSRRLGVAYAFASQPVRGEADLEWAAARRRSTGPGARFRGFKLMTDGSFDEGAADLRMHGTAGIGPLSFDRDAVQDAANRILDEGFALALNADGDAAVRACVEVFDARTAPLPSGCSISDASVLDDSDAVLIARLGLRVEYYTQILRYTGYTSASLESLLTGAQRGRLANLSALLRSGVAVASGSDFPLFDPSLPEAMLSSSARALGRGPVGERWTHGEGVARDDVISVWTDELGALAGDGVERVLTTGANADVVVFDRDLLTVPDDELVGAAPRYVFAGGDLVLGA